MDADGDIAAAVSDTPAESGPALVRVRIERDEDCLPMLRPGGAGRE